ncbi:MAG: DUF3179 domain-containing protein [Chloroflexi bacterium]|nr:DUF3179 domain-containing protein [Chloroflexota bacterium]
MLGLRPGVTLRNVRAPAAVATLALLVGTACSSLPQTPPEPTPAPEAVSATLRGLNPSGVKLADFAPGYFDSASSRDAIRPIYDPVIARGSDAKLDRDDLVIGVSLGGESRAYPIVTLRTREMVNDELAGVPILVTW